MIRPFLNQDFNSLKSEVLAEGRLFEDEKFPSNHISIYRNKDFTEQKIEWKRPSELFAEPKFFLDSIQAADLNHGLIKNCQLIDSIPTLLNNRENFYRTIPDDQNFSESSYAGIFHFRFWLNGQWVDVVVDDRLPVGEQNQLLFCNNRVNKNEMYAPLLEKAYAKFKVCYEFLSGLILPEILLDLTGAVAEQYNLTRCLPTQESDRYLCPNRLWEILCKYSSLNSLFTCSASLKPNQRMDQLLSLGIHGEKEYTISKIYEILKLDEQFNAFRDLEGPKPQYEIQRVKILLIQNPVGKDEIYKGKWKADSVEWMQFDSKIVEILSADKSQSPNQFLMDYDEFFNNFTTMNIFHPNNANSQSGFKFSQIHNEWVAGVNSGGCGYYPAVYWTNPQHEFIIPTSVKHSMGLISIIQKDDPETRISQSETFLANSEQIGFHVYAIKPNAVKNSMGNYEKPDMKRVATIKSFKRQRQVAKRVFLPPSKYIIMPCTYDKDKSAKYLLQYYFDIPDKYENKESDDQKDNSKDLYEKWYFEGMSDKDIENLTRKAQSATSAACSIM